MGVAKRREDRRLIMFEDAHSMWTEGRLTQEQATVHPLVLARHRRAGALRPDAPEPTT